MQCARDPAESGRGDVGDHDSGLHFGVDGPCVSQHMLMSAARHSSRTSPLSAKLKYAEQAGKIAFATDLRGITGLRGMIATQPIEKGEAICTVRGAGLGFRGTGEGFGERLMGDAILRVSIGVSKVKCTWSGELQSRKSHTRRLVHVNAHMYECVRKPTHARAEIHKPRYQVPREMAINLGTEGENPGMCRMLGSVL